MVKVECRHGLAFSVYCGYSVVHTAHSMGPGCKSDAIKLDRSARADSSALSSAGMTDDQSIQIRGENVQIGLVHGPRVTGGTGTGSLVRTRAERAESNGEDRCQLQ